MKVEEIKQIPKKSRVLEELSKSADKHLRGHAHRRDSTDVGRQAPNITGSKRIWNRKEDSYRGHRHTNKPRNNTRQAPLALNIHIYVIEATKHSPIGLNEMRN